MIYIPFLFFSILTVYLWNKHKGMDVCVYMSGLYAFTAFLCIVVVLGELAGDGGVMFDEFIMEISPVPTVLYCLFITIGIMPFSLLYKKDLKKITNKNPTITMALSIFLICIAFLNLYLVAGSTMEILSGDLRSVRLEHGRGLESPADIKAQSLPYIIGFLNYFKVSTLLALPLFFYYICFEKKPWWFLSLLLFASLSLPIYGIQSVDRTEIVFFGMMFISCLILFHQYLSKKIKRILNLSLIPFALASVVYLGAVTEARFGDRESGSSGGLVQYGGQNFLNFCFFWEMGDFNYITTEREFPLYNHFVLHKDNNADRREERSGQQGFFMSVFASYIGDVMLDLSPIGMVIWCLCFFVISMLVFKKPHREELTLGEYLFFFYLSAIPIFGIFYYRYMSFHYTFMLIVVLFVYITDKYKFIYSRPEEESATDL